MKRKMERIEKTYKDFERKRILNDFYTQAIKKGKKTSADRLDFLGFLVFIMTGIFYICLRVFSDTILALILGSLGSAFALVFLFKHRSKTRDKKIKELKKSMEDKLRQEKIDLENYKLDDYIVKEYMEEKKKFKSNINIFTRDKIFKLYLLALFFLLISYLSSFPIYYKLMSLICFTLATIIGGYNFTEYLRLKDKENS